ncbi:thiol-disulfide oxidoreductase DCC family protein [Pelagicoccus mobilis]|uniref:DUF393 domain-containing protein n=1 Tax=Pelagicoccus mobilis TaxID=415221 RepID=A0A934RY21_9BACT|nr:DCC1-like thiol-disulfide oxidoreductase family protein [Pelagicoccus mobilis]MBK1875643.1 DUF393 domain-containing protein [Pelagicoccus mobilis]
MLVSLSMEHLKNIVFFDGVCGFCNKSVDLLIRLDDDEVLRFAPLQGDTAKSVLSDARRENLDTICFFDGDSVFTKTRALLEIGRAIGGGLQLSYPLVVVPARLRDPVYDWVAERRYRWFGKSDSCRMPSPEERRLFLD